MEAKIHKLNSLLEERIKLDQCLLEQLSKSILQQAIQGRLVAQVSDDEPASELLKRISEEKARLIKEKKIKADKLSSVIFKGDDNKYYEQIGHEVIDLSDEIPFDIPDSWSWVRLGALVSMSIGKTPSRTSPEYWKEAKYPWVAISDMQTYGRLNKTKECISEKGAALLGIPSSAGSLLMSFKLSVGKTVILDIPAYHNEAIITISPLCDVDNCIRNYLFLTLPLISQTGDSKDAIKGKTLNSTSLYRLLIPLPPYNEIRRISMRVQALFELLQNPIDLR